MITVILQIVAAVAGIAATWYFKDTIRKYLQLAYDYMNRIAEERLRRESEDEVKRRQEESDRLKDIEGR
jgi:hypothetical protein